MPTVSISLEPLEVSNSISKTNLWLESSVSLKCEQSFSHCQGHELLGILKSGEVWACRGNGFHLDFTVIAHEMGILLEVFDSLIDRLAAYLQNELFWRQLSLKVLLNISKVHVPKEPHFSLNVNHIRLDDDPSGTNNLLPELKWDIQPPNDVPFFELMSVNIWMDIRPLITQIEEELMLLDGVDDTSGPELGLSNYAICQARPSPEERSFESLLDESEGFSDETRLLYQTNTTKSPLTPPESQASQQLSVINTPEVCGVSSRKRKRLRKNPEFDISAACQVASYALRTLIGGRQSRQKGMRVGDIDKFTPLSDIVPSLWSPGFLQTMIPRSLLLPSISSTFCNSIFRDVQSPSLKRKLLSLRQSAVEGRENNTKSNEAWRRGENSSSNPSEQHNGTIQARLWRMMYLSLYKPDAARRLKFRYSPEFLVEAKGHVLSDHEEEEEEEEETIDLNDQFYPLDAESDSLLHDSGEEEDLLYGDMESHDENEGFEGLLDDDKELERGERGDSLQFEVRGRKDRCSGTFDEDRATRAESDDEVGQVEETIWDGIVMDTDETLTNCPRHISDRRNNWEQPHQGQRVRWKEAHGDIDQISDECMNIDTINEDMLI